MIAGISAAMLASVRSFVRGTIFPAPTHTTIPPIRGGRLRVWPTRDGASVRALVVSAAPGAGTVVHFHGNGETIGDNVDLAAHLAARGLGVALVEYRGYGVSRDEPRPTEDGLYADAEAALDGLRDEGVASDEVVLWGTSIGSGVATEMARRGRGRALVLVTPYTSIPDVVRRLVPFVPVDLIVTDRFDSRSKAASITVPTLIVHGTDDEIIPYDMGRTLSSAIRGARLLTVEGGHHNDLFARDGARLMAAIVDHARGVGAAP